ncbi:MAG: relaxase/mobilization nuclease domain-containing protein, partial [Lachnospiraceae bacterium]|nr:relaxase/mobilization nuclease domain-containing protein [Lachnospiraceae bacterium]
MAINKVVNSSSKSHGAMRNAIGYVLRSDKVTEGYVDVTGPYGSDEIDRNGVYKSFLNEKKQWGKDSGRMYSHNVISFHKNEKISPAQCLEIGKTFVGRFFGGFQSLLGLHQDKDHLHCHIITNTVSFIDGHKLHQTKHDLEEQKAYTNQLCRDRGLSVAEKGRHFNGSQIEEGQITAWNKDKYNLLASESKKSYLADCAIAIMEVVPGSASREEFVQKMAERGWTVKWFDSRKHIVYQDKDGHKVRDSNIEKTFALAADKEALEREFE